MVKNETLEHSTGHKFVDNGVGDYDLVCPTHGKVPGFVPYMLARIAPEYQRCRLCGQSIGKRMDKPEISDWELIEHNSPCFYYSARRKSDGFVIPDLTPYGNRIPDHLL